MSVIDFINKKHKVLTCVVDVLSNLYGKPNWLVSAKQGQDIEAIIKEWVEALGDYSERDLKTACYRLYKYKKCSGFPSLAHVLAMLTDNEQEQPSVREASGLRGFCLESELFERDVKSGKPFYMPKYYSLVVKYVLGKRLLNKIGAAEYRELELSSNDDATVRGKKYRKAVALGLFEDMDDLLARAKNGEFY